MTSKQLYYLIFISLITISSCVNNEKATSIRWRLDVVKINGEGALCDDISFTENSCILLYKNEKYKKINKVLLNNTGDIDSIYSYSNPLGVYKMSYKEYLSYSINISKDSCDKHKIYFETNTNSIVDKCDTFHIENDLDFSDTIAIKVDNIISLYYFNR